VKDVCVVLALNKACKPLSAANLMAFVRSYQQHNLKLLVVGELESKACKQIAATLQTGTNCYWSSPNPTTTNITTPNITTPNITTPNWPRGSV